MKIWLVTIGEPWPTDGVAPRLHRTGTMARIYARGGDEVVWFNNTFDHYKKKHRYANPTVVSVEPNLTLVGLYGRSYSKNISVARIMHHRQVAANFLEVAETLAVPDIIVASMPPLELSRAAVRYGKKNNVPVIVDIRDLWPDIFLEAFPKPLLWAGRIAIAPFYRMLHESVNDAAAVSGVSEHAVDWALVNGGRPRRPFDGQLPLARQSEHASAEALESAGKFWDAFGITENSESLNICFLGNLTRRIEFDPILAAARMLPAHLNGKIKLVLCGAGDRAEDIDKCAKETNFLIAPGWVNAPQISVLMKRSQVGILPYPSSDDYVKLMPNKFFDYLGGGLPILTSLTGHTGDTILRFGAGWLYRNNNPQDLLSVIMELSGNRELVTQAAAGSAKLAKLYSADVIYGEFRERLKSIVKLKNHS